MVDWMDIHSFVTIVRERSITKASQVLHITQPTLTARLKKLESEFNVPLLERSWKGVELTDQGHRFLLHALKLMEEFNKMHEKLKRPAPSDLSDMTSKLKFGISRPLGPFFISPALQLMKDGYPEIKYDLLSDMSGYILDLISVGKIHLGILPYISPIPGLNSVPLCYEDVVLLTPRNNSLLQLLKSPNWIKHLLSQTFYFYDEHLPLRPWINQELVKLLGRMPDNIYEVNDSGALLNLVSNGYGCTVLPVSHFCNAFDEPAPERIRLNASVSVSIRPEWPYHVYYLPFGSKRPVYIVYKELEDSELPLRSIIRDIRNTYNRRRNEPASAAFLAKGSL